MAEAQRLMSDGGLDFDDEAVTNEFSSRKRRYISNLTNTLSLPSKSTVWDTTKQTGFFLLPTFIQSRLYPLPSTTPSKPLSATAWLDGMRGIAAFLVFIFHITYATHDVATAWTPNGKRDFLRLPLLRFFYHGPAMVSIFFVLSGGDIDALLKGLSSSVFRRGLRLYLPCVASTFVIFVFVRVGLYEATSDLAHDGKRLTGYRDRHEPRLDGFWEQVWVWASSVLGFVNPFTGKYVWGDGHLWTIPLEFLRMRYRMFCLVGLMAWAHHSDHWVVLLFFLGFMLADLDIRRSALASANTFSTTVSSTKSNMVWTAIYIATFIGGIYIGGQPEIAGEHAPGWTLLYSLIPSYIHDRNRYWCGWGALLLVWSTSNSPMLQRIFTARLSQYMGKISFALYLAHGFVIHTVYYSLLPVVWGVVGRETKVQREVSFGIALCVVTVVLVCVSDIFMRCVDGPSVKFARWLEGKMKAPTQVHVVKQEAGWRETSAIV
ncbi:hypothetical protein E4T49_08278 [Aureobasidium sp. EXF-10728]|nr:hypothetical protein E4T49_08278 [Aureobasidium sp. EXF-10728]